MKKTDIGVVVFMYLVCGYFYYHMTKLKASSQTYPRFTIILLFGLTTLYLVQMIIAAKKYGVESGVNEVFKDFQAAQFFVCLIASILYLVCIYFFGFYISTVLFMAAVLLYLKVPPLFNRDHDRCDCRPDLLCLPALPRCEAAGRHGDESARKVKEG